MSLSQSLSDIKALPEPGKAKDPARIIIKTFGLNLLKTEVYKAGMPANNETQANYGSIPIDKKSKLGTPIFSNIEFQELKYQPLNVNKILRVPNISFDTVLFTVSQTKNIVKTAIQGRNGTVKQYISDGDYEITIRGIIDAPNGIYPKIQVENLIKIS